MDNMYPAYNQAGPSNYSGAYVPNHRPPVQHNSSRGRGYKPSQHHYPHPQHAPFYGTNQGTDYTGSPIHAGNEGYGALHGTNQYGFNSAPPVRHVPAGPVTPSAPLLPSHPSHLYAAHPGFYPPVLPPHGSPLYHTAVPPPHIQSYPTALPSQPYYPPYSHTPSPSHPATSLNNPVNTIPTSRSAAVSPAPSHDISQNSNLQRSSTLHSPEPAPTEASDVAIITEEDVHIPQEQDITNEKEDEEPVTVNSSLVNFNNRKPIFLQNNELPPSTDFVVLAQRPKDPRQAPGFSISLRAFPKSYMMKEVLPHSSSIPTLPSVSKKAEGATDTHVKKSRESIESSVASNDLPSESATETESRASTGLDANAPTSPWTTSTSVSSNPPKTEVDVTEKVENTNACATNNEPPPSKPVEEVAQDLGKDTAKDPAAAATTKKSWASLFAGTSSSSSSLPKSGLIGFSVSGTELTGKPQTTPIGARRKELISLLTNGPRTTNPLPATRPRGLTNTGNMCFANAVLQTLVYTPLFLRFFSEFERCGPNEADDTYESDMQLIPLVSAVAEFLKEFRPSKELEKDDDEFKTIDSFNPSIIYDAMKVKSRFDNMGGGQQEDAEEFFGFFLDTLEDELLALLKSISGTNTQEERSSQTTEEDGWLEVGKKNRAVVTRTTKSASSPMTRIFGGKFRSTLKVPGQRDSAVLEDWRSLKLDIESDDVKSVEDALRYSSHPQQVQLTSVTKGGATVNGSQQFLIESLPPVLVLHLKRFHYDTKVFDVVKLRKQVDYGPELVIPSDIITPTQRSVHPVKYKLFSVVYHHGHSAAGGHYTADLLHTHNSEKGARPQESWIRIDDELVSDVREQDVFGKDRDCAYLLFYRRLSGSYARAAVRG